MTKRIPFTDDGRKAALAELLLLKIEVRAVGDTINGRANAKCVSRCLAIEHAMDAMGTSLLDTVNWWAGIIPEQQIRRLYFDPPARQQRPGHGKIGLEEHWRLGWQLMAVRTAFSDLFIETLQPHLNITDVVMRKCEKIYKAIDGLRSDLENVFCKQYPDAFETHAYYCSERYESVMGKDGDWRDAKGMYPGMPGSGKSTITVPSFRRETG